MINYGVKNQNLVVKMCSDGESSIVDPRGPLSSSKYKEVMKD